MKDYQNNFERRFMDIDPEKPGDTHWNLVWIVIIASQTLPHALVNFMPPIRKGSAEALMAIARALGKSLDLVAD